MTTKAASPSTEPIKSYKGLDQDFRCRGVQYAIGETVEHAGTVEICTSGLHACEYPLDVLAYYPPASSRYAEVEQGGATARHVDDSKIASSSLRVTAEIGIAGLIKAAIDYTMARVTPAKGAQNAEERGAASNSGDSGAASNSGDSGAASNSGYSGAASNSGDRGAASNSGYSGAASNSGYRGAASNSGDRGAASNSGDRGAASNSGTHGIAADSSGSGKVRSIAGGAIFLVRRNDDGSIAHVFASKVGENGIEPDVWYELNADGTPVEATW